MAEEEQNETVSDPTVDEAVGGADAPEAEAAPAEPAAPALSKKEARAAAQHAEASGRTQRTAEERQAERDQERTRKAAQRRTRRGKERAAYAEKRAAEPAREPDHAPEHGPGAPKVRQGIVVSDKADKTIVVRIDVARRHRRYGKIMRTSSTLHAHDETNDANAGDTVRVIESRPLSRTKRWRLVEVVERAQ
jgi:small subunit ribosomal protein S17